MMLIDGGDDDQNEEEFKYQDKDTPKGQESIGA